MSTSGEINLDVIIYIIYYNITLHYVHNKRQATIIYNLQHYHTSGLAISVPVGIYCV